MRHASGLVCAAPHRRRFSRRVLTSRRRDRCHRRHRRARDLSHTDPMRARATRKRAHRVRPPFRCGAPARGPPGTSLGLAATTGSSSRSGHARGTRSARAADEPPARRQPRLAALPRRERARRAYEVPLGRQRIIPFFRCSSSTAPSPPPSSASSRHGRRPAVGRPVRPQPAALRPLRFSITAPCARAWPRLPAHAPRDRRILGAAPADNSDLWVATATCRGDSRRAAAVSRARRFCRRSSIKPEPPRSAPGGSVGAIRGRSSMTPAWRSWARAARPSPWHPAVTASAPWRTATFAAVALARNGGASRRRRRYDVEDRDGLPRSEEFAGALDYSVRIAQNDAGSLGPLCKSGRVLKPRRALARRSIVLGAMVLRATALRAMALGRCRFGQSCSGDDPRAPAPQLTVTG